MQKKYSLIFVLLSLFILSGCQGVTEIDRVNFPFVLGIDFDDDKNIYTVYAQLSSASSDSGGQMQSQTNKFEILEGEGDTLLTAINDISDQGNENISWKHVVAVIFSKSLAKRGIDKEVEMLIRLNQFRLNTYLLVADDDIKKLIAFDPMIQSSMVSPLSGISLISKQSTDTKTVTIKELIMNLLNNGTEPTIPLIKLKEQGEVKNLDYEGLVVFREAKLVGSLTSEETRNALWVIGTTSKGIVSVPYPKESDEKQITVNQLTTKTKFSVSLSNNVPTITVKINAEFDIAQFSAAEKLDLEEVERVNSSVSKYIKKNIDSVIQKTQKEFSADIFGLGETVYRKFPKYWLQNKHNWPKIYSQLPVIVEVKSKVLRTGDILNGIKYTHQKD